MLNLWYYQPLLKNVVWVNQVDIFSGKLQKNIQIYDIEIKVNCFLACYSSIIKKCCVDFHHLIDRVYSGVETAYP